MDFDTSSAINTVLELVPQWYEDEYGPYKYEVSCNGNVKEFCSQRPLTPQLNNLLDLINSELPKKVISLSDFSNSVTSELVQKYFAISWLKLHNSDIDWEKLFDYFNTTSFRTYENHPILRSFIISPKEKGENDITSQHMQKILDPLMSSLYVYFKIDSKLNFIEYKEIEWQKIIDDSDYKFHPDFLQPVYSAIKPAEFSAHITTKGDWIIMNAKGLLAARRRNKWKIYDVRTLKNSIADCAKKYRVGCNIFETLFDLSFKRCGALIVYDPDHKVVQQIQNQESILKTTEPENMNSVQKLLVNSIYNINMLHSDRSQRKKRLFIEIAGIDGAIIFDDDHILAFGAMIKHHKDAKERGARSIAAHSAFLHGGIPFKISADGDITVYFDSEDDKNNHSNAKLNFL